MGNTQSNLEEQVYRPADLALLMGVDIQQIYRWMREGRLPHVRLGRAIYTPRPAWEAWMSERTQEALATTTNGTLTK
jgi:excisionase family DNA binding protein